jgi:membrane protease YdiL (CAAX protease family)
MDFNWKKPTHLFSLLALILSIGILIVLPIISFFLIPTSSSTDYISNLSESVKIFFEIILLLLQFLIVAGSMVIVPLLWYVLVNKFSLRVILAHLNIHNKRWDKSILYGIGTVALCFIIIFIVDLILIQLGFNLNESSNITDLEQYFSLPAMFVLLTVQPIAEEIFFRGFLLEKIQNLAGAKIAILTTAILFGLAHLSYGKVYPAFMTAIVGIIFAYLVVKTRNLKTVIIAHILFNVTSFVLYLISQSLPV